MLSLVYALLFLLSVAALIRAVRNRKGFGLVILFDLAAAAAALGAMGYYDRLSARNTLAGWAYFPEVFSSLIAAAGFALLALISAAVWLLRKK